MDFGTTGQDGLNLFDPEMAVEMTSSLQTPLPTLPRMNVDWDGGFAELTNQQPAGPPPGGVYPAAPTAMGYPHAGGNVGYEGLCAPGAGAFDSLVGALSGGSSSSFNNSTSGSGPEGMLAIAHNSTRAARNGREQQRAQKISDVIDKLKGMLDKAKFTTGDSSSKLHVLVSCESYIRKLQDRTRCHEMEAKLRSAASGNQYSGDTTRRAGARGSRSGNDIEWTKKSDRARRSAASQGGETDADTVDGCTSGSGADRGSGSSSSSSSRSSGAGDNGGGGGSSDGDGKKKGDAFFDEESSSTTSGGSSAAEESRGAFGGGAAAALSARRAAADSAGSASSSVEEDGDTGSSGDSSGGDTLAGTTTDSRGFTTDSSFSGDSGSADSGDAGSADGGSEGSEESASSSRMRVVNYFDMFRLSNVPMAIADKEGALVDVNDAMRGFGRIDQDTVKTLTVKSLVAPESSKALEDAMSEMLVASSVPQENRGPAQGGSQPFLANAGIGDRPTVLTVSLVYDERGEASAFHVALIPMAPKDEGQSSASCGRSSTEYNGEAPGLCVDEALRGDGGGKGDSATGKRSVRVWDSRERTTSQKRPAIKQHQSSSS